MFGQLLAVTRNTFVESIRQPFFVVWMSAVGLLVVLAPYLSGYTFDNDNVFALELELSALLSGGLVLAAFTAAGVISREIENRTVLTVISKPIPRPVFIVGKYLGIIGSLIMAWWVWAFLLLLALRQGVFSTTSTPWDFPVLVFGSMAVLGACGVAAIRNYLFHEHFGAAFTSWLAILLPPAYAAVLFFQHDFTPHSPVEGFRALWPVYMAQFFILQAIFLFAAVATACSTRLGQVPTLAICIVVFLMGLSSDFYLGRWAALGGGAWYMDLAYDVLYAITPNLGFHWLADALVSGNVVNMTASYFINVTLYTGLLVIAILGLAVALFQTRQTA